MANPHPTTPSQEISDMRLSGVTRSRSRSINATLQKRDSNGRFSSVGIKAEVSPPKKRTPSRTPVDRRRSLNASSQRRNYQGRFTGSEDAPSISPEVEMSSSAASIPTDGELVLNRDDAGRFKKASAKAKKAPAKSPYFASPPIIDNPTVEENDQAMQTPKKRSSSKSPRTPKSRSGEETPKKPRTPGGIVSCIPFPPLSAPYFGLIQEKLAHDPFRLLIAVTFLIRTHGKHAIPVFYELMEKYPTPEALVSADKEDIVPIIRHLGLQNQRAGTYQTYAKIWLEDPPTKGMRYAVRDYPTKGAGKDVKRDEVIPDDDERIAWEIGHMTQGPYAIDSWRIFCRDELRGVAKDWNGKGAPEGFQPEWMRVVPEDKELRAYLRWMWLKEGFEWDPFSGDKEVASERLMKAAIDGRIAWDDMGGMRILDDTDNDVVLRGLESPTPGESQLA